MLENRYITPHCSDCIYLRATEKGECESRIKRYRKAKRLGFVFILDKEFLSSKIFGVLNFFFFPA